jgi:hypothetical protein
MNTLTLTSQSGKTVSLLNTPVSPEFIHVNGTAEPLVTVNIPQGTYTSATASLGLADFTCATVSPTTGTIATDQFSYDPVPADDVSVSLPDPITVIGKSMVLSLNLLVSLSASYTSCYTTGIEPFTLTPNFSITPSAISTQPTSSRDGKLNGLEGVVASINSAESSLIVNSVDNSNNWQVAFNGSSVYQGITGPSQLAAGMVVDMDASIQEDGSLLATRIAVYDTDATDVSLWSVPMIRMNTFGPQVNVGDREGIGPLLLGDGAPVDFSKSAFNISGQLTNLATLPFPAEFTGANMVAGQNIELTFHAPNNYSPSDYGFPAATITLLPQTINGTVGAVSTSGGFTTYTVTLAAYDLFPSLAVQVDQATLLTNPGSVVVYADSNTQLLNTSPIAVGSVVRFYGLVFNDNGTLRMDCAQINDGVAE